MTGPSLMDTLFQRTLDDLIKGLRLHTTAAAATAFVSKSVDEIRREIKSTDYQTKSAALQKLTYLHSIHGVDMSWAAFHAVEVAAGHTFAGKKIGYLAASLSFKSSTDVLLLLTNQLRKDLSSGNEFEVSIALECLSIICNSDLACDLTADIFTLLGTSKNFVRKKAIATLLKVFSQYPDAVRVCFKRLVESLESPDPQTMSVTVGVFCELAMREPKSYLPLAPEFYRILVDSRNNWVLIKVLKLFAKLVPLEPRLGRKVVEPICDHMRRSGAKSLVFECVRTIVTSLTEYESALRLAVTKIREFLVDDDPNLKYLGLQGLTAVAPNRLWAVLENKEVVIKSLSDGDQNIRVEALRLVMAMVSEDNLSEICRVLINYALKSDPEFCNEILGSILSTCSRNVYEIVIDFDWYVLFLGEMSRVPNCQKGEEIERQIVDIGMRVKDVRRELVRVGRALLIDPALLGNPFMHRILSAAAWVSGEYVEFSRNPFEVIEALLQPRTSLLPPLIRSVYIQSTFKVLTFCLYFYFLPNEVSVSSSSERACPESLDVESGDILCDSQLGRGFNPRVLSQPDEYLVSSSLNQANEVVFKKESVVNTLNVVETSLSPLAGSPEVEIEERVRNVLGLCKLARQELTTDSVEKEEELKVSEIIKSLYDACSEELGPVSRSAQERVPIPEGLVLEENLCSLETICGDIELPMTNSFSLVRPHYRDEDSIRIRPTEEESELLPESTSILTEHRKRHGLFYLPSDKNEQGMDIYPPANDPIVSDNPNQNVEDLVKLTEDLVLKRKPKQVKPRPVVVKFDEGDGFLNEAKKSESKDELISGAVQELLSDNKAFSSRSNEVISKENVDNAKIADVGTSSSRGSKQQYQSKERKHGSSVKNDEGREKHGERGKRKSSSRSRKTRGRANGSADVVTQNPAIPDFLL